jgi:serine/threonine protein kinase
MNRKNFERKNINLSGIGVFSENETSFVFEKCQEKIDNEIDNKYNWIYLKNILQNIAGKDIITILAEIEKKNIVLKIQNFDKGKHEFDIQENLKNCKGFVQFCCHFNCLINKKFYTKEYQNTKNIKNNKNKICSSKGNQMWINVMPYYNKKSLEDYLIKNKNFDTNHQKMIKLTKIIKKLINNYSYAFRETGFVHKDFEPKNIILDYHDNPIIIDFENSNFSKNIGFFWSDLDRFFIVMSNYFSNKYLFDDFIREHIMMNGAFGKQPTTEIIDKLLIALEKLL